LVLSVLLLAGNGWGATYFVDQAGGNDANLGTSPGSAWKTISKVNRSSFSAGDSILFKRGEMCQEQLEVPSSGNAGNPITFGAYGAGAKPIITGKDIISGWEIPENWTDNGGNIWYKTLSIDPHRLWLSEIEAHRAKTAANFSETWYWDSGTNRLYVYSIGNPARTFKNITHPSLPFSVYARNKNYVTFSNIDLRGARSAIVKLEGCDGIIVEYCDVGWDAGFQGIYVVNIPRIKNTTDNGIIRYNTIDSGDRLKDAWETPNAQDGIILTSGANNWLIYGNTVKDWGHSGIYLKNFDNTYTLNKNKIYNNTFTAPDVDHGRGINADSVNGAATGNEIYRNLIVDTNSKNQLNMSGLKFYYNIIDNVVSDDYCKYLCGYGIALEGYGNTTPYGMEISNNVIVNCDEPGIRFAGTDGHPNQLNNLIRNNIIQNNGRASKEGHDNYQLVIDNHPTILGNTFKNNIFYKSGSTHLVYYGHDASKNYSHTVAEFNQANGTSSDVIGENISSDPLFVNEASRNYNLRYNSPAINAGTDVSLTSDFAGNLVPRGSAPDIGAYEYISPQGSSISSNLLIITR
jgi:hypothetical protein